jgi:hypothetical protein
MTQILGTRRELYLLCALLFVLAALVTWVRTSTVKDSYLYVQREKEFRAVQQDIQAVRVRWLRLTAPKRLESLAQTLGLAPPKRDQILKYEPETRKP